MLTRNVSIRDSDQQLWARALELAGAEVVAQRLAEALSRLVAEREGEAAGDHQLAIKVPVLSSNNWVVGMREVAFWGRELARRQEGTMGYTVAFKTKKGKLLIQRATDQGPRFGIGGPYLVHESLTEARKAVDSMGEPQYDPAFLDDVAKALGETHRDELDI